MTDSTFICARCGLGIHRWGANGGWKHAAGGPLRGCGQPPKAVERSQYEADLEAEIDVMHRNGWGIDEAREEVLARWRDGV
jgi:hypothetical protein